MDTMSRARFAFLKAARMLRTIALTGFCGPGGPPRAITAAAPGAGRRVGNIFSDPPLRPPGRIPRGQPQQAPDDDEESAGTAARAPAVADAQSATAGAGARPHRGAVQGSQPLAPPPGTAVIPQNTPSRASPVAPPQAGWPQCSPNAPPGANPACRGCRPDNASPRTCRNRRPRYSRGDEVVSEPPATKIQPTRRRAFPGSTRSPAAIIKSR